MTSLRVFTCEPYGARLRPEACAQRFPRQVGKRTAHDGPRADRIHCHECPVGAAHARGEDAPGVEYSLVDVGARVSSPPIPPPKPPKARPMTATTATTTETRPPRPCAHPDCGVPFVPTWHRSLYCDAHRTPEAAAERKKLRDELDAALERAAEATRAKTEPPTPHAPAEPEPEAESDEAVRERSLDAATAWATRRRERAAAGWVPDCELDHTELAKASADEVLEEDGEHSEKWVPWRWLLDHRTKALRGLRNVVAATKEAVGEAWTKDRPLSEAVTAKCEFLERQAEREARLDVKQSDRLQHAMSALIEIEGACREDLDEAELAAEWISLDAEGLSERASELAEFIIACRRDQAKERDAAKEPKTFVEAFVEAITPPPGVGAAAVLRAVGYQVVTVDSPRGPVIVVEGARG